MEGNVRLAPVSDEIEAEALCGLLRSAGIECGYRPTEEDDSAFEGLSPGGRQEILVHGADLENAQAVLAGAQS